MIPVGAGFCYEVCSAQCRQLIHSQCPSGFALALCPTLLSDQEKVMSQPRNKLLEYIPLPPAMQVCNTAAQFTCTPDKTIWFENALSVFGDLAGRALQEF